PEGSDLRRRNPADWARLNDQSRDWRTIMSHRFVLTAAVAAVLAYSAATTSAVAQSRTLYERLGGYDSILAVVDEGIKNIAADKRINKFFAGANIPRLRR